MPYIQNTETDVAKMLKAIGTPSVSDLFDPIPEPIRLSEPLDIPAGMPEIELAEHMKALAAKNSGGVSFLGAGAYDHFVPTVVDHLAGRAEFYTAYTPYQPEASQGMLQAIFEYQTQICQLTDMEISNASLYDGATAMVEAVLMALNITRRTKVAISRGVHPEYRRVLTTYLTHLHPEILEIELADGLTDIEAVKKAVGEDLAAVVFQTPNFFGAIEDGTALSAIAHEAGALLIPVVDPISLGLLKPPGEYDADIAVGEGQSLGNYINFGGPYIGFMGAREKYVRRMPGRIVGETVDLEGKRGFVLTFQTREQHIRREKATSNICTNQGLLALRSAIYMSAVGKNGLKQIAQLCLNKAHYAAKKIVALNGYELCFDAPFFKEFAVRCPRPVAEINRSLADTGIIGGYDLGRDYPERDYPEMENCMLLCVTEKRTAAQIDALVTVLGGLS